MMQRLSPGWWLSSQYHRRATTTTVPLPLPFQEELIA
jgi:hypothetical protein